MEISRVMRFFFRTGVHHSSAEMSDHPEDKRKHHAEQQARDHRKIERAVAPLHKDIAGQTPQPERQLRARKQKPADASKHYAENQQPSPEFPQRLHLPDCSELSRQREWRTNGDVGKGRESVLHRHVNFHKSRGIAKLAKRWRRYAEDNGTA
jgi:hypothetical protein